MRRIRLEGEPKLGFDGIPKPIVTLRCVRVEENRYGVGALGQGKRGWKPANCGASSDLGAFDGFPDQADSIDLDLMEEATLDLSAGSCRREYEGV